MAFALLYGNPLAKSLGPTLQFDGPIGAPWSLLPSKSHPWPDALLFAHFPVSLILSMGECVSASIHALASSHHCHATVRYGATVIISVPYLYGTGAWPY